MPFNNALNRFGDEESMNGFKKHDLKQSRMKPARMAFKPNDRPDDAYDHDDGLNAFRGILSGVALSFAFAFILFLLGVMIWA